MDIEKLDQQQELFEKMMEEMANAPREEMGKRTPGERGGYERQNIERARDRYTELGLEVPQGLREIS